MLLHLSNEENKQRKKRCQKQRRTHIINDHREQRHIVIVVSYREK